MAGRHTRQRRWLAPGGRAGVEWTVEEAEALPFVRRVIPVVRAMAVVVLALLGFELWIGGGDGLAFVWFYVFPPVVFLALGEREGLGFFAASLAIAAACKIVWPSSSIHYQGSAIRFLVSYRLVGVVSFAIENSSRRHIREVEREREALEDAFAQIKTLRGMLPICAWCKKIRDDQGYWSQLEAYFAHHSDLQFTHSICPGCAAKLRAEGER